MASLKNGLVALTNKVDTVPTRRQTKLDLVSYVVPCRAVKHNELLVFFIVNHRRIQNATFFLLICRIRFQNWIICILFQFHNRTPYFTDVLVSVFHTGIPLETSQNSALKEA